MFDTQIVLLTITTIISSVYGLFGSGVSSTDYECPSTTTPLGPPSLLGVGVRFNCVQVLLSAEWSKNDKDIDDCEAWCRSISDCHAFQFSYSGWGYWGRNSCKLFSTVGPVYTSTWFNKAGSCAINADEEDELCPVGSTIGPRIEGQWPGAPATQPEEWLVGEFGTDINNLVILTIEECRQACCETADAVDPDPLTSENEGVCAAFSYEDTILEIPPVRRRLQQEEFDGLQVTPCYLWNELAGPFNQTLQNGPFETFVFTTCEIETNGCPATLECPAGSTEIGRGKAFDHTYSVGTFFYKTIEECQQLCEHSDNCFFYQYDDHFGRASYCILFETGSVGDPYASTSGLVESVICEVEKCPDGSSRIGGSGSTLDEDNFLGNYYLGDTIEECKTRCDNDVNCKAFQFDYDVYGNWYGYWIASYNPDADNVCNLFSSAEEGDRIRFTGRDVILCEIDPPTSAKSPQHLNFEPVSDTVGNNGATSISGYVIYGIIGLILVNIICLTMYCCMKNNNGDGKRYKVVSVGSEDESTDV